jgi:hypothetical protein
VGAWIFCWGGLSVGSGRVYVIFLFAGYIFGEPALTGIAWLGMGWGLGSFVWRGLCVGSGRVYLIFLFAGYIFGEPALTGIAWLGMGWGRSGLSVGQL